MMKMKIPLSILLLLVFAFLAFGSFDTESQEQQSLIQITKPYSSLSESQESSEDEIISEGISLPPIVLPGEISSNVTMIDPIIIIKNEKYKCFIIGHILIKSTGDFTEDSANLEGIINLSL